MSQPESEQQVTCPGCGGKGEHGDGGGYCVTCDGSGRVDPCCVCGRASTDLYGGREDCPSCGQPACELQMQSAIDYHDERGG